MKRSIALLLAVLMVIAMIPVSLLPALAHGKGVGANDIENLSIDNAPNQAIPATINIDGKSDDTGWAGDEWNKADGSTGIWSVELNRNPNFTYKYQLHVDYEYLYGVAVIDAGNVHNGTLKEFTFWLNDGSNDTSYTAKVVITFVRDSAGALTDVTCARYSADGTELKEASTDLAIEKLLCAYTDNDGIITVEFRTLISVLTAKTDYNISAFVSALIVDSSNAHQYLYHPRVDAAVDNSGIDPAKAWPENAIEISQREIYSDADADYSKVMSSPIVVDGELDEGTWQNFTTYYANNDTHYEYYSDGEYELNTLDLKYSASHQYADVANDKELKGYELPDSPIRFKYDIRSDGTNLYGAAVVYADALNSALYTRDANGDVVTYFKIMISDSQGNNGRYLYLTHKDPVSVKADGTYSSVDTSAQSDAAPSIRGNWAAGATYSISSHRENRFIINMEFRIPYASIGVSAGEKIGCLIEVSNHYSIDASYSSEADTWSARSMDYFMQSARTDYAGNSVDPMLTLASSKDRKFDDCDGEIEQQVWPGLAAADKYVEGMARYKKDDGGVDKGTAAAYNYDVFMDYEYIYGAAIIESSEAWKMGAVTETDNANINTSDLFRLWINNDRPRWLDTWDYVVSFYINSDGNTCYQLRKNDSQSATDSIWRQAESSTAVSTLTGTIAGNTIGIQAEMRVLSNDEYAGSDGKAVLLEFKIPIELVYVSESKVANEYAFSYYTSVENGTSSFNGLAHPMCNNYSNYTANQSYGTAITPSTGGKEIANDSDVFYPALWVANDAVKLWSDQRQDWITVDSKGQDTFWNTEEERIEVDSTTGSWLTYPDVEDMFDYSYRILTGREYLYGMAEINAEACDHTNFTLWINNDPYEETLNPNGRKVASTKFEMALKEGSTVLTTVNYNTDGTVKSTETNKLSFSETRYLGYYAAGSSTELASYTATIPMGEVKMTTLNGVTYVEFMLSLEKCGIVTHEAYDDATKGNQGNGTDKFDADTFYTTKKKGFEYVISVTKENNTLFYPTQTEGMTETMFVTHINELRDPYDYGASVIVTKPELVPKEFYYCAALAPYGEACDGIYEIVYSGWVSKSAEDANPSSMQVYAGLQNALETYEGSFVYAVRSGSKDVNYAYQMFQRFDKDGESSESYDPYFHFGATAGVLIKVVGIDPHKINDSMTTADIPVVCDDNLSYNMKGWYSNVKYQVIDLASTPDLDDTEDKFPHLTDGDSTSLDRWDASNAFDVPVLGYYVPEAITVDGVLDDSGWAEDKWIEVSNDSNGNLQNENYATATALDYKYQLRTDGEYVYVAAIMNVDPDVKGIQYVENGVTKTHYSAPQFRIWIKSGDKDYVSAPDENGVTHTYDEAVSFTHLFDVTANHPGDQTCENLTIEKYTYTPSNYVTVEPSDVEHVGANNANIDWNSGKLNFGDYVLRYAHDARGFYDPHGGMSNTVDNYTNYGSSVFYGETVVTEENTVSGVANAAYTHSGWYAKPEIQKYTYASEHGAMNTSEDGTKTIVEFKFALSDIGCEDWETDGDSFEYFVQGATIGRSETEGYVLFYPGTVYTFNHHIGDRAQNNLPFWEWADTAAVVDAEYLTDIMLRNPMEPVSSLGAQTVSGVEIDGYDYFGVRFGVLYNADYLDLPKENNSIYDNATYWDAKEIGMLLSFSSGLKLNGTDVGLYTENCDYYVESDMILNHQINTTMADYENYIFYSNIMMPENYGYETAKLTYRGFVEYYPSDQIYYDMAQYVFADYNDHYSVPVDGTNGKYLGKPLELTSTNDPKDIPANWTFRPTYYSSTLTRSYDLIQNAPANLKAETALPGAREEIPAVDANGALIAYVPLDDRPVNLERVEYLAQASGFKIIMPDYDTYTTTLNNDYDTTTNISDQGDPEKIYTWLKDIYENGYEGRVVTNYVLSLDQLFSGGLVGSRAPFGDEDDSIANTIAEGEYYTLSKAEQDMVDLLVKIANDKEIERHTVYFDTVMRLASTGDYQNYTGDDYTCFRFYGAIEREQFYGNDLTINNIVDHYNENADGEVIAAKTNAATSVGLGDGSAGSWIFTGYDIGYNNKAYICGLTDAEYKEYFAARERKLRIADALYPQIVENVDRLYIGVDDSNPKTTIQTNECRYITDRLIAGYDQCDLFAGADELGLMGIADVATYYYGNVHVNLEYFGDGKDLAADGYDKGTLHETVKTHISSVGGTFDYNSSGEMDILILTQESDETKFAANVKALVDRVCANEIAGIPTCVVDASTSVNSATLGKGVLAQALLEHSTTVDGENYWLEIGTLMGYSEWNTVSNALGIGISNAIARYTYIANCDQEKITDDSHIGFYKATTFGWVKEYAYQKSIHKGGAANPFPSEEGFLDYMETYYDNAQLVADNINVSDIYIGKDENGKLIKDDLYNVSVSNLNWPWGRDFEANFDIAIYPDVDDSDDDIVDVPSSDGALTNLALGKSYTTSPLYQQGEQDGGAWDDNKPITFPDSGNELTDGTIAADNLGYAVEPAWIGFNGRSPYYQELGYDYFTIDLGAVYDIYKVDVYLGTSFLTGGISVPDKVELWVSEDGVNFTQVDYTKPKNDTTKAVTKTTLNVMYDSVDARYVQVRMSRAGWMFVCEAEVYGE